MAVKYYTQFRLTDEYYRGGNEFSGIVELSRPMDQNSDVTDIEAVLAKNFDLRRSSVKLLSWSRLHGTIRSASGAGFPPRLSRPRAGIFLPRERAPFPIVAAHAKMTVPRSSPPTGSYGQFRQRRHRRRQ
jgi:hypothetical protein